MSAWENGSENICIEINTWPKMETLKIFGISLSLSLSLARSLTFSFLVFFLFLILSNNQPKALATWVCVNTTTVQELIRNFL